MIFTVDHLTWCIQEAKKAGLSYGQWRIRYPDTRAAYKVATGKDFVSMAEKSKPERTKVCPNCKKEFSPENMNRVYCSLDCKLEFNLETGRERSKKYQEQLRARRRSERSVFIDSEEI